MGIVEATGLAFLGGMILNIMPCVLPVLTLKVFHTLETFGDPNQSSRVQGLAYALGTTTTFILFAGIIVLLRAAGHTMGWGMHFQHPPFVAALTLLIFVFGLNALGVFEIQLGMPGAGRGGAGWTNAFINGVFAAIMSTPCTAPFLGTAASIALAAQTPDWQTLWLFSAIGLGLASPYVLLTWFPQSAKLFPKPGAWMETFKQLMGFTLMGTAIWLFGALQVQLSRDSAHDFLIFVGLVAFALWAMQRFTHLNQSGLRRWGTRALLFLSLVWVGGPLLALEPPPKVLLASKATNSPRVWPALKEGKINWHPFDPAVIEKARLQGRPIFVDYTADWCAACKTNEKLFLETDLVRETLQNTAILPMMADMTNEEPVIEKWLGELKRDGVPVTGLPAYAIYFPGGGEDLLPVTITAELVKDRLEKAAKKFPPPPDLQIRLD